MKNNLLKAVLLGGLILLFTIGAQAQSTPWACFFAGTASYNGIPAPVGTVIDAYDPDGIHCGSWIVHTTGLFGAMAVVGDDTTDPDDPTDEGAVDGDVITFYINGLLADCIGDCTWTDKATKEIALSVVEDSVEIALQIVVSPGPRAVRPGETISVKVGVENLGNALDLFGITAYTDKGWTTIPQDSATHADPGDTVYVYFRVIIPLWPGEPPTDVIHFTVFSHNDPSVTASGTASLTVSVTDVDDPIVNLPGSFELYQNYPNPFNPTTTFAFNLASLSHVNLQIYDITGRLVDERDLGSLSAGNHQVEFNAGGLASGVYLYRLATETTSQTKKMILVK
ncbi:MAG: T9SS type A sorting domain-containing protein [candidate division Zixibacteria bacterium]|nr:T9SS type A sorting domain-containing protein [candidate division Zixibacteria bacterium]